MKTERGTIRLSVRVVLWVAVGVCAGLAAYAVRSTYLSAPPSDPERAYADPSWVGMWVTEGDEETLVAIHAYDARTYLIQVMSYRTEPWGREPEVTGLFKAWTTPLNGDQVLTMQPLEPLALLDGRTAMGAAKYFAVDARKSGEQMSFRVIDVPPSTAEGVRTTEDAAEAVRTHLNDLSCYLEERTLHRLNTGETDMVRSVLKAFHMPVDAR